MILNRVLLLFAAAAVLLQAQAISEADRKMAVDALRSSATLLARSVDGLTDAQWKFKPAPDRWSIAECAEHLAVTEDSLFQLVTQKVLKSDPVAREAPASREQDETIIRMIRDRSKKADA